MVNMGVAMGEYWKDNLGVDLDLLKRRSGMPRRDASQLYRISLGSWIPDPIQIVSNLTRRNPWGSYSWGYRWPLDALIEHARSLPLDHPERCAVFQAVEEEYMDKVYMMPIRWQGGVKWVVQPVGRRLRELQQPRHQHAALDVRPAALGPAPCPPALAGGRATGYDNSTLVLFWPRAAASMLIPRPFFGRPGSEHGS